jgi:catechol 2,3-dioxygenase-like lactoylglutathione lyase family enzyme
MQRMHLHVSVPDLAQSIRFYETLFGAPPSVVKDDYAKWMSDDPRVNFAISQRATAAAGVDHIGIQTDTPEELQALSSRLKAAGANTFEQEATTCCYAKSDKTWVNDPAGVRWESFYTFGEATTYGEDPSAEALTPAAVACCGSADQPKQEAVCC